MNQVMRKSGRRCVVHLEPFSYKSRLRVKGWPFRDVIDLISCMGIFHIMLFLNISGKLSCWRVINAGVVSCASWQPVATSGAIFAALIRKTTRMEKRNQAGFRE